MNTRETGRGGFQSRLIDELRDMFPGCVVIKNDPIKNFQGIPDLLILYRDTWAMLEVKASDRAHRQPNQEYYVNLFDEMSFGAFISPDNKEDVLDALQRSFGVAR